MIATASISNKWRNRSITSQTALNADLDLQSDFVDFVTDNRILVNGLIGFGLEIADHRFRFTNLYIRDTLKQSRLSLGENNDGNSFLIQDTGWFERQLIDSQLVGELKFGDLAVDLRGGYAQTQREAPYEYNFQYERTNNPNEPFGDTFINTLDNGQTGSADVSFSSLSEDLWFGGIDISYPVFDFATLVVGYAYSDTDRVSTRRELLIVADTAFPDGVGALRPDLLLGDAVIDFYDIGLIDGNPGTPAFGAELTIHAAYGKAIINPVPPVTIDVGVRYEDAEQSVSPIEVFTVPTGSNATTFIANDYFLPAATVTWEASDALQFRLAASKTIARPQFRELIFQPYFNPETNRQFNGNPNLIDSELLNAEARVEYYFGGRENRVSLAGFYKKIDNPIEVFSSFSDNEQISGFANAPEAQLYGAELDLQYNYDLLDAGGWLSNKRIVVVANYTYTQSELKVAPGDETTVFPSSPQAASDFFRDGAPLTGQSDHLANLQIGLENVDRLQQLTFLASYASERVTSRGTANLPDIVENPGFRLDFVAREAVNFLGQDLELKFEARNIFGRDNLEYQDNGTTRIDINTYDVGQSFSLSVSAEF